MFARFSSCLLLYSFSGWFIMYMLSGFPLFCFLSYSKIPASFADYSSASIVLDILRRDGPSAALKLLDTLNVSSDSPLLYELFRLHKLNGPRILIDGIWFSRAYGGISRVWAQILSTWSLSGLVFLNHQFVLLTVIVIWLLLIPSPLLPPVLLILLFLRIFYASTEILL